MNITLQEGEAAMTKGQYNTEIKSIAESLVQEVMQENPELDADSYQIEEIIYDRLHETIDGHQWIIYYSYNDDVIRCSGNADAYQGVYSNEDVGALIADKGLDQFGCTRAYFAMHQDVSEQLEQALQAYEIGEEA